MPSTPQTPLLASFSGILAAFALTFLTALANAQTASEVQQLMKQGKMTQTLEKVDAILVKKPKDAQGRFLRGLILTDLGRQSEAISVFTKLTEDFPELPEPYNNLAVLYAQEKQYDKARVALEMAIHTHPSYLIAHENLGDVYAKLASQAYDKALQLDTSNTKTQTKLSMINELIGTATPTVARAQTKPKPAPSAPASVVATAPVKPSPQPPKAVAPPPEPQKTEPAKKAEAPIPAVKTEKAPANGSGETDIVKSLHAWASAWSHKDVKNYLGHYAADFQTPRGMSRKTWETQRAQRIDKPGKLQIVLDDIKVTINGDKATARFRQHYTSATLDSSISKTIDLVKTGGKWLIQRERAG